MSIKIAFDFIGINTEEVEPYAKILKIVPVAINSCYEVTLEFRINK